MTETLISFEIAKLAKEKKFNENTDFYYRKNGKLDHAQYYDITPNNLTINENWMSGDDENLSKICTAPTQSLLQRWLREKHHIHIRIDDSDTKGDENSMRYYPVVLPIGKESIYLGDVWKDTYEEALEVGLEEALKLINDD